ncbi:MAG: tyrosine-type recombinase/integrase, partial [Bacteroidota bacterium]
MDIQEAITQFLSHCKYEKNLSDFTQQFYEIDLRQFSKFLDKRSISSAKQVGKTVIRDYVKAVSHHKPNTTKRKLATIKVFFNFLEFEDIIPINPFRKINISIKAPKKVPVSLSLVEVKKLFDHLEGERKRQLIENNPYYTCIVRDIAILELMFASGMRVREICAIKLNDIDFDSKTIKVWGKGSRERLIYIPSEETWVKICSYYQLFKTKIHQLEYFFISLDDRNINPQTIRLRITKYTKASGIKKNVTPHTFRHTYATLLLEQDVDLRHIQHFLGHSSITTTQMYTKVNSERQREILKVKYSR